ncbi:2OG-Fe(II) oxygenase superfamily protein [Gonapodya prolifera JEL478]|uniref:2OG-Fe(II) oxygenase superfamily protein n=1 Tax=Gonapodya prolifera (strain JEL478) TaxID=1344416 RepID=A0A139AZW5_GONPJ|nr:2OG-Fe(II) oxygenase superfamily protein [Gonapodya prolifera JEL478]|eukprot:KXS22269.1 2OG-Fe(II) oxygenase superfamily protein [Gonapodya prolifera JEL478]
MPVAVPLSSYDYVPETKENLEWADLPTVDLSKIDTPEGKQQQAQVLIDAVRTKGFFYVTGYAISQARIDAQFAIGQKFYELPLEEKLKLVPDLESGDYNGYRPAGRRIIDEKTGLTDRTEVFNLPKFLPHFAAKHANYPPIIADNIVEIELFARDLHTYVLDPLFDLTSIALGLPEHYLRDLHKYENLSEDHLRYMKYSKYSEEETAALGYLWGKGHTDLGTYTLLARQPVAALQIRDHTTGQWAWVKPQNNTFTVNACDALSFLTGGYIKSTIHRVAAPPVDQRHVDRLGLLYFARPKNDLVLSTIDAPVLKGKENEFEKQGLKVPTMEEFVVAKQKWQQGRGSKRNDTILPGFHGLIFD